MLLGSNDYDDNSDDSADFVFETTQAPRSSTTSFASEEIKREERLFNKLEGEEKRKRTKTRYENKDAEPRNVRNC